MNDDYKTAFEQLVLDFRWRLGANGNLDKTLFDFHMSFSDLEYSTFHRKWYNTLHKHGLLRESCVSGRCDYKLTEEGKALIKLELL
jgi:hypothetical protein